MKDNVLEEYILCKEIYHCTPEELDNQDAHITDLHFYIYCLFKEKEQRDYDKIKTSSKHGNK